MPSHSRVVNFSRYDVKQLKPVTMKTKSEYIIHRNTSETP